jgi:hypothetical protein
MTLGAFFVSSYKEHCTLLLCDLRNKSIGGDTTSKVFEYKSPKIKESQRAVDILFNIYTVVYGGFDKIIHLMDRDAYKVRTFPNWSGLSVSY